MKLIWKENKSLESMKIPRSLTNELRSNKLLEIKI